MSIDPCLFEGSSHHLTESRAQHDISDSLFLREGITSSPGDIELFTPDPNSDMGAATDHQIVDSAPNNNDDGTRAACHGPGMSLKNESGGFDENIMVDNVYNKVLDLGDDDNGQTYQITQDEADEYDTDNWLQTWRDRHVQGHWKIHTDHELDQTRISLLNDTTSMNHEPQFYAPGTQVLSRLLLIMITSLCVK
ncbi:hypothetical protein ABW21_db0204956 [Orbilia brochopaga]|nr:hypothetical protein ABW21_db0204956 [Drechslerella brochopaga]